jgi:hypothetical protein
VLRNNLATKLDYRLNDKNAIYITGGLSSGSILQPNRWGKDNVFNLGGTETTDKNPYAAIGDTLTLNPSTVLDVRYGLTHIRRRKRSHFSLTRVRSSSRMGAS